MDEILDVSDGENKSVSKEQSFKKLVLDQYHKCLLEGSKEMTEGGVKVRLDEEGNQQFYYADNQQEIFINSVKTLRQVLSDNIKNNKDFMQPLFKPYKKQRQINEKKRQAKIHKWKVKIKNTNDSHETQYEGRKEFSNRDVKRKQFLRAIRVINKTYDKLEVQVYRLIFIALTYLIAKLKFFDKITGDE